MRIVVTGASGFVGRWFCEVARAAGHELIGLAHEPEAPEADGIAWRTGFDLRDGAVVERTLREAEPDAVVHLAAVSSVGQSWRDVGATLETNLLGTTHLLRAAMAQERAVDLLLVGSAEVYGAAGTEAEPLREECALAPANPYAATKAAQEMLALGLRELLPGRVILTRSFPHTGPGQAPNFVIPNWTRQLVELRARGGGTLEVGDTSVVRDIADVRDVAAAYLALLESEQADGVYNVCTGRGHALSDVLAALQELVGVEADVRVDPSRLRPTEIRSLIGSPARLQAATGWQPQRELRQTLADVVTDIVRAGG